MSDTSDMRHKINQAIGLLNEVLHDLKEPDKPEVTEEVPYPTTAELVTVAGPHTIKAMWMWLRNHGGAVKDWKYCCEQVGIESTENLVYEKYKELSQEVTKWIDKHGKTEIL